MKSTSIIRERGQLTIPESIRRVVNWVTPLSAVSISVTKPDEIVIRPHQININTSDIWKNIQKSRAISGKGTANAVDFLIKDRNSH